VEPHLAVSESPFVKELEHDGEHIRVRLLNFVQQDHGVRTLPELLCKLPTFLKPYVARRGANELGHLMFGLELGHVHPDEPVLVVLVDVVGQLLGQLCFSNSLWAK